MISLLIQTIRREKAATDAAVADVQRLIDRLHRRESAAKQTTR